MRSMPHLYNITDTQPFLQCLAQGLFDDDNRTRLFDKPFALSDIRILLPTRRAARSLTHIFWQLAHEQGQAALLLPRISTLGDVGDEMINDDDFDTSPIDDESTLPLLPAIGERQRHFYLMRLIGAWHKQHGAEDRGDKDARQDLTPATRAALAYELAHFLDQAQNEQIDWRHLPALVPDEMAANWQQTLDFLKIITAHWPQILKEDNKLDIAEHRRLSLQRIAAKWAAQPPTTPIIAAGSTGSIGATADLLSTIAHLPLGAVVLAGLDMNADALLWQAIQKDPTHPQAALAKLLEKLSEKLEDTQERPQTLVKEWHKELESTTANMPDNNRADLLAAALVPALATAQWAHIYKDIQVDCGDFTLLTAPDQRSEAGCIALKMRSVIAQSTTDTAALVTRDRTLARRVAAELRRWGLEVDDSAGQSLAKTPSAMVVRLVLGCWEAQFDPVQLLSLLKHPRICLGKSRKVHLQTTRLLERYALRGAVSQYTNLKDWCARLTSKCEKKVTADELKDIKELLAAIENAFAPFITLKNPDMIQNHLEALVESAAQFCATPEKSGREILFATHEENKKLYAFLTDLYGVASTHKTTHDKITHHDWRALFEFWLEHETIRYAGRANPRLFIWGPLEARLMQADMMIVGGLNEGSWPPTADVGAWLSRSMRAQLGMHPPEQAIGQAAHDFVAAACAPRVLLTRAAKVDGTPTVEARWLRRLR
ncbi:MAG: double-strand break repair protein AddB, partial [Alphaproteobacteria bacterium]|nr:double-strand break repair protein AddB [Alphaproteobacteria bacterium]